MEINYQETTKDLQTRINIHDLYGSRNIDEWMLEVLPLKKGMNILDIGCGAGKQIVSYHRSLDGDCTLTGGDVNQELLDKARNEIKKQNIDATILELDFNNKFPFEDNQFDLVSCSFAIYYALDIPFTISEIHRVLKPGGTIFTTGPLPENKQTFYDIIKEATSKTIPPMPGSSRYKSEIFAAVKSFFSEARIEVFENPLTFPNAEPFLQYTQASLSEDRKLWNDFFNTKDEFSKVMSNITDVANKWAERDGKIVMTKVVGGIIGKK